MKTLPRTFDKEQLKMHNWKVNPYKKQCTQELERIKNQEITQYQTPQESITWFNCTNWYSLHQRDKFSAELILINNGGSFLQRMVYKISVNSQPLFFYEYTNLTNSFHQPALIATRATNQLKPRSNRLLTRSITNLTNWDEPFTHLSRASLISFL